MTAKFCSVKGCHRYMMLGTIEKRWGHRNVVFICGFHWKRLTAAERKVFSRIKRLARRFGRDAVIEREMRIWSALLRRAGLPA